MVLVLNELEEKLSWFYGTRLKVSALAMDAWLCSNSKEVDNVIFCLEPNYDEI